MKELKNIACQVEKPVLVSIACITYNHKKYIREALDGFLMQKTSFGVEILIHDDASTDGSQDLIKEYEYKYPNLIKPIYQIMNQKSRGKKPGVINRERAKGKYIALCEGDDYWTDPYKLQKQVEFLESHPNYIIHSGKAQILKDNDIVKKTYSILKPKTFDIRGFYTLNRIYTCTVMFRNISIAAFEFEKKIFGDWINYISLLSSKPGNLAFVSNEVYAVYRVHRGGIMQTVSQLYKNAEAQLTHIYAINKFINCEYSKKDIQRINDYCLVIFSHYLNLRDYKKCLNILCMNMELVKFRISVKGYMSLLKK